MTHEMRENRAAGILWMLATMFCFISLDTIMKHLLESYSLVQVTWGRFYFATIIAGLACGRHISCDRNSHGFMREIPQCWITGQAAGVAAALAVSQGVQPRAVDLPALQAELVRQGVYLRARQPVIEHAVA